MPRWPDPVKSVPPPAAKGSGRKLAAEISKPNHEVKVRNEFEQNKSKILKVRSKKWDFDTFELQNSFSGKLRHDIGNQSHRVQTIWPITLKPVTLTR